MPRTRKYDVNESIASSQATIISRNNDNSVRAHENHTGAVSSRKKNSFPTGWCVGVVFGALCLAFILCVAFIKVPGVPTERVHQPVSSRHVMIKQGYFQIYPSPSDERSLSSPRKRFIYLSDMSSSIEELKNELNGYSEYTDVYTTCFVSIPTFSKPCFFEKEWLGSTCTEEKNFGYEEINGTINPCILLKLKNLTDWRPLVYQRSDVDKSWINDYDPTFSSVACIIPDKHDESKLNSIKIYPSKGMPNQFFPVSGFNQTLYLQPSVMIQINGLRIGQAVTIQCWLRVSNAYMLADDGEILVTIGSRNATNTSLESTSLSSSSSETQHIESSSASQHKSSTASLTTESLAPVTTKQRPSTLSGLNIGGNN